MLNKSGRSSSARSWLHIPVLVAETSKVCRLLILRFRRESDLLCRRKQDMQPQYDYGTPMQGFHSGAPGFTTSPRMISVLSFEQH